MRRLINRIPKKKLYLGLGILGALLLVVYLANVFLSRSAVKVYFLKDEKLVTVRRSLQNNSPLQTIAASLSAGPTISEQDQGYYTEIPRNAAILSVAKKNGSVVVDFNSALEAYGGGATRILALISQIVYSFTELPGIDKVKITVAGASELILGGEGFVIDKPLSRKDLNLQ